MHSSYLRMSVFRHFVGHHLGPTINMKDSYLISADSLARAPKTVSFLQRKMTTYHSVRNNTSPPPFAREADLYCFPY